MANYAAREQERAVCFGKGKQTDIATAQVVANMWRLTKLEAGSGRRKLNAEDDAAEYGKGHEFAEAVYPVNWDQSFSFSKYLSAEMIAWACSFGLGTSVKSGTTPNFVYTCTPLDFTTGLELPYFTWAEQVRASDSVTDFAAIGCAVEGFMVEVSSGPGRAASRISIDVVGSGKETAPSTITFPAATAEKLLGSATLAATINGTDYITLLRLQSLRWGWKNNLMTDQGFYPGSGTDDGAAIRGRLEVGTRQAFLSFVARKTEDSDEMTKILAGTTGTAVITQTYDSNNTYTATFQKVGFKVIDEGEDSGLITVNCEMAPMYHASNGLISVVCKAATDGICEAPA